MSSLRYRLDRTDRKKQPCPGCGETGCWRPYIDTVTGEQLGDAGRCDRENACAYHKTPAQYLAEHGLKPEATPYHYVAPQPKPKRTDWRCPDHIVALTQHSMGNVFAKWLVGIIGDRAREVLREYRVGTYPEDQRFPWLTGSMCFWQIGEDQRPRTAKVIPYGPDGKRIKQYGSSWIHTLALGEEATVDALGIGQVLYGTHLLKNRPNDPVAIVESEKSALICACFYPSHVWLATGGMHGLSLEKTMCLSGRDVTLFPDQGALEKWTEKAMEFEPITSSLVVSDIMEAMGATDGEDLADYLIRPYEGGYYNEIAARGISIFGAVNKVVEPPDEPLKPVEQQMDIDSVSEYPPALRRMIESNPNIKILLEVLQPDLSAINFAPLNG